MIKFLEVVISTLKKRKGNIVRVWLSDGKKLIVLDEEGPFKNLRAAAMAATWIMRRATDTIAEAFNNNFKNARPIKDAWNAPSPKKNKRSN